jgi:integrase
MFETRSRRAPDLSPDDLAQEIAIDTDRVRPTIAAEYVKRDARSRFRPLQVIVFANFFRGVRNTPAVLTHNGIFNRCTGVYLPSVPATEASVLQTSEIPVMFAALRGRTFYPLAVVALGTGMRRGELLALRWQDVNLDKGVINVERSLEQTRKGLRFKSPKSARGKRTISLAPAVVTELRAHWKAQQEQRLALGLGKSPADALVFGNYDGAPFKPDQLSGQFARAMESAGLPHVTLHTLRHTHASQLIAAGIDIITISRRLGHHSPTITLNVYGHLLTTADRTADIVQSVFVGAGVGQ